MSQELVMTLVNNCECAESGECLCTEMSVNTEGGSVWQCGCECECINCEVEYIVEGCGCGGNCKCSSNDEETYQNLGSKNESGWS